MLEIRNQSDLEIAKYAIDLYREMARNEHFERYPEYLKKTVVDKDGVSFSSTFIDSKDELTIGCDFQINIYSCMLGFDYEAYSEGHDARKEVNFERLGFSQEQKAIYHSLVDHGIIEFYDCSQCCRCGGW